MKSKTILFFTLIFMTINSRAQDSLKTFIDSISNEYLKKNKNLALIIGINNRGSEQIYTYGETEIGNKINPQITSIFEIGQITQVFTSIIYADMIIKGEINSDDQIQMYLPVTITSPVYEKIICKPVQTTPPFQQQADDFSKDKYTQFVCKPDPDTKPQPILLCYLSTHTSGLPDNPSNLRSPKNNPYDKYTRENLYQFLQSFSLSSPFGYDFKYSNLGIALLGHILELKSKTSYQELITEHICSKIEMPNTKISLESYKENLINGHTKNGKIANPWTFEVMAPCGALHSNMSDMMKFLSANISKEKSTFKNVLDFTHNPRILISGKNYNSSSIALGWMVCPLEIENLNYIWQSGLTGGFASFIGFVETSRTGVVILSNVSSPVDEIGKAILQKLN